MLRKPENEEKWLNSAHVPISFPEPFQQHRKSLVPIDLVIFVHNTRENTTVYLVRCQLLFVTMFESPEALSDTPR